MPDSDNTYTPEKTLSRRFELIEELYDLTTRQRQAIQSQNWDDLKTILDAKDQRIHDFEETERCLKGERPLKTLLEENRSLQDLYRRIQSRLVAIQSVEAECARYLTDRKERTARDLREIRRAREGIKRFKSHRMRVPRFVDLHK